MTDNLYEEEGKYYDAINILQDPADIAKNGLQIGEFHFHDSSEFNTWLEERGGSYEGFKKDHDSKISAALEAHTKLHHGEK